MPSGIFTESRAIAGEPTSHTSQLNVPLSRAQSWIGRRSPTAHWPAGPVYGALYDASVIVGGVVSMTTAFVASVREKQDRRFIGIGFSAPKVDFWHVVFPKAGTRQAVRSSQTGSLVNPEGPKFHPQA